MKPTALLTNDDGINAAFLHALVAACVAEGFRVLVAAPSGERSWIGRAFSRHREVTLADYPGLGEQAWSIDGTPSDCVNIALGHLLPGQTRRRHLRHQHRLQRHHAPLPELRHLGRRDRRRRLGLPAVACSLDLEQSLFEQVRRNSATCPPALRPHLEIACRHAARFAKGLVGQPVSGLHVHSLNYPAGMTEQTAMERSTPALVRPWLALQAFRPRLLVRLERRREPFGRKTDRPRRLGARS
jgi:5'-nucleotidase